MRQKTLRLATLLALLGGTVMVAIAFILPVPQYVTGATSVYSPRMLRSSNLLRRRAFNEVLRRCDEAVQAGTVEECPDINDPEEVRAFLRLLDGEDVEVTEHPAAALPRTEDLTDQQLAVLRRMTRVGSCDEERLNTVLPGLYELCVTIVGPAGERGHMQMLLNRLEPKEQTTSSPAWTLEEYLKAFGGKARPDR